MSFFIFSGLSHLETWCKTLFQAHDSLNCSYLEEATYVMKNNKRNENWNPHEPLVSVKGDNLSDPQMCKVHIHVIFPFNDLGLFWDALWSVSVS